MGGDASAEIGGQYGWINKPFEGELWMETGDQCARGELLALIRDDAGGAALFDQTFADRAVFADVYPARGAAKRHRLGDCAHAANRVAPDAPFAIHLAQQ
jgi:hypothetical protein